MSSQVVKKLIDNLNDGFPVVYLLYYPTYKIARGRFRSSAEKQDSRCQEYLTSRCGFLESNRQSAEKQDLRGEQTDYLQQSNTGSTPSNFIPDPDDTR
jgi:hypothetical protein